MGGKVGAGTIQLQKSEVLSVEGPLSLKFCQIFHYCPKKIPEPNIFEIPWSFD